VSISSPASFFFFSTFSLAARFLPPSALPAFFFEPLSFAEFPALSFLSAPAFRPFLVAAADTEDADELSESEELEELKLVFVKFSSSLSLVGAAAAVPSELGPDERVDLETELELLTVEEESLDEAPVVEFIKLDGRGRES